MNPLRFLHKIYKDYSPLNNSFKEKSQEKQFARFLLENNFICVDKKSDVGKKLKTLKKLSYHENFKGQFIFIEQPFGSQKQPDFIIIIDGWVLWLELKRSNTDKISWNTGYPKTDVLYVFDSKKLGRVIFFGQDHPEYGGLEEKYIEMTKVIQKYAQELFQDSEFSYYNRKMLKDKGTYNREELFEKAINLIKNLDSGFEA